MRPPAKCHPERENCALGMCSTCYGRHLYKKDKAKYIARSTEWHRKHGTANLKKHYVPAREGDRRADCHPELRHYSRGMCMKCYDAALHRKSYPKDRLKRMARAKKWYHSNKVRVHLRGIAKKFGISEEEYAAMMERQKGLCAICGKHPKFRNLAADHSHVTGQNRELLCTTCNAGLGQFYDSPELLEKAAAYLRRHSP